MSRHERAADKDDQPLDPAAERVRQRLVRFAIINIGILFVAVIAVLGAIVYKTMSYDTEPAPVAEGKAPAIADGLEGAIDLPQGARIVSQSLSGSTLSLLVRLANGGQQVFLYDLKDQRLVGRLSVNTQGR